VREYRTPGSVRGAPGNRCPYLDATRPSAGVHTGHEPQLPAPNSRVRASVHGEGVASGWKSEFGAGMATNILGLKHLASI
jgi:hypothetical protein